MARVLTQEESEALDKVIKKFKIEERWKAERYAEEVAKGRAEMRIQTISMLLTKKLGKVPKKISLKFNSIHDAEVFYAILDIIDEIKSYSEVEEVFKNHGV